MPSYKDESKKVNKWYCSFYYTDINGSRIKKKKQGFSKKADADAWEREFLLTKTFSPSMSFESLTALYIEDMSHRLRESTIYGKQNIINDKLLPFFGKYPVDEITPVIVRTWQNNLIREDYAPTYLKMLQNQLTAIFNYAVKYHNLKENPCHKAGTIGKSNAGTMEIWTVEEFNTFISGIDEKSPLYCGFHILFWCGLRIGELLALTWNDIDFDDRCITINKSYRRLKGKDLITPPKTEKSNRTIAIDSLLLGIIERYRDILYNPLPTDRMFPLNRGNFYSPMKSASKNGAKRIRLHDLRHSHASFLINNGISPLAIAQRLGHEKVETTLTTYAHLYPEKENEIIDIITAIKTNENK